MIQWQHLPRVDVGDYVRQKSNDGEEVRVQDGSHWNGLGHKFAAEIIFDGLAADLDLDQPQ